MGVDKKVSIAVIKRLPRYYRYLGDLLDSNVLRISSGELSRKMGLTASQIRQDLNNFGCFGQQGYGYNVQTLYDGIKVILGLDKEYSLIIIGAGNLGQAIANYPNFKKRGFNVIAMFDADPEVIGTKTGNVEISPIDSLDDFLKSNNVDIAVLTLPSEHANEIAAMLAENNIKGIWNFTPTDLNLPSSILVENAHLSDSLMTLSYRLNEDEIYNNFDKFMK